MAASHRKRIKRKALGKLELRRSKRVKANAMQTAPSPLLDLPKELRDMVYDMVGEDMTAHFKEGKVTSLSGLELVNHQVRNECLPKLFVRAKDIQVVVEDFNFSYLVNFINRLTRADINALPSMAKPDSRNIRVRLLFSEKDPEDRFLKRWLNRAGHPAKKGTKLNFYYAIQTPRRRKCSCYHKKWAGTVREWHKLVVGYFKDAKNERSRDEATKVLSAWDDLTHGRRNCTSEKSHYSW